MACADEVAGAAMLAAGWPPRGGRQRRGRRDDLSDFEFVDYALAVMVNRVSPCAAPVDMFVRQDIK